MRRISAGPYNRRRCRRRCHTEHLSQPDEDPIPLKGQTVAVTRDYLSAGTCTNLSYNSELYKLLAALANLPRVSFNDFCAFGDRYQHWAASSSDAAKYNMITRPLIQLRFDLEQTPCLLTGGDGAGYDGRNGSSSPGYFDGETCFLDCESSSPLP